MTNVLQIKKYPNRRYYDATRRCHVTLHEVYDLVVAGNDICVMDSKTGEDITNLILFQVLLEKDQPKLELFPASVLHMMIRSNRQALHSAFEGLFGPFLRMVASSHRQFDSYLRTTMAPGILSPLEWAQQMLRTFPGASAPSNGHEPTVESTSSDEPPPEEDQPPTDETLEDLRRQLSALAKQIENLRPQTQPG